jgi:hypothetical protein
MGISDDFWGLMVMSTIRDVLTLGNASQLFWTKKTRRLQNETVPWIPWIFRIDNDQPWLVSFCCFIGYSKLHHPPWSPAALRMVHGTMVDPPLLIQAQHDILIFNGLV